MDNVDFKARLKLIADRFEQQKGHILTEEATKNALIMPFIQALGYDVFNPGEVVPEFTADVGIKQGEKVDYAIKKDNTVIILFECKACSADLDNSHASQLYRYFSVVDARFAILTNGVVYRFFSDLDNQNKMDEKPFFEFSLLDMDDDKVEELKKFCRPNFELETILSTASDLKYTNGFKQVIKREFENPSEDFVRFIAAQVYSGRLTQGIKDQFQKIVKKALNQFITEKINQKLATALSINKEESKAVEEELNQQLDQDKKTIVTTEEELQAYYIVKSIVGELPGVFERISHKDTQSYFGVMVDNIRGWFCRFAFNTPRKQLLLRQTEDSYSTIEITSVSDIYQHKEEILAACKLVLQKRG